MTATKTAIDVMAQVFGAFFAGAEWDAWRAFVRALFGLPMADAELEVYRACTGRQTAPVVPLREAWLVVGRRGGKSRIAAFLAVFCACFRRYKLAPGERGTVIVIAADRAQAKVVLRYIAGLLEAVPMLAAMVTASKAESIDLSNGISIEVHTASYRTVRGRTVVAAILDEIAFWRTEEDSANPDSEIVTAIRPAMATVPGALLIALSSPYARRGELWKAYERHFGKDGSPVLVWQAATPVMNPSVPADLIAEAYAEDEASAAAEYGAEFRRDIELFLPKEVIAACVVPGRRSLPGVAGANYVAFVDPAGGTGQDSFTLAIGHRESARVVVDALREARPPFSPEGVVADCCGLLAQYGVRQVTGDRYAGAWPREAFQKHGVFYTVAESVTSDLYRDLLPVLTSGRVELLDEPRLLRQLERLERRTARSGKDSIGHPPRQHDDLANVVAGLVAELKHARHGVQVAAIAADEWGARRRHPAWGTRGCSETMAAIRAAKSAQFARELEESRQRPSSGEPFFPVV